VGFGAGLSGAVIPRLGLGKKPLVKGIKNARCCLGLRVAAAVDFRRLGGAAFYDTHAQQIFWLKRLKTGAVDPGK
jgi:hypothetical protein